MFRRPGLADLVTGIHSRHQLPDHDDTLVRTLVDQVFQGSDGAQPLDPRLVRQLLHHAPDREFLGAHDMNRGLRADEIAAIFGVTPPTRRHWLLRADEIARAWGRPLLGNDGLVQALGPDAPGDLPDPDHT